MTQPMITGVVTDPSGRRLAGVVVVIAASPVPVPDIAALTGEDGRFSITVPVPGVYRLLVRGEQASSEIQVVAGEDETEHAIRLTE